VLVDTSVGACSAFNAACWMIKALNQSLQTNKMNKMYLLHLSSLKAGFFTSTDKKEETAKTEEKCCKTILSWYGRRCWAYGITFNQIGIFCEKDSKSSYNDKLSMIIDRFEIGGIFVGNPKMDLPSRLRANVFRINRRMGTLPDKYYLKELIHAAEISNLKSFDESSGISGLEAKIDNDFVEYRFVDEPQISDQERTYIVAEINGEPTPRTQTLDEILPLTTNTEKMNEEENVEDKPIQESNKSNKLPAQEPTRREENILQQDNVPISDSSKVGIQEREIRTGHDNEASIPIDSSERLAGQQQQPDRFNFIKPSNTRQEQDNEASIPIDSSERMVGQQQPDRSNIATQNQPTQLDQTRDYEAARTDSPYGSKLSQQETQEGGARYNAHDVSV
jgi:hypothetical protein